MRKGNFERLFRYRAAKRHTCMTEMKPGYITRDQEVHINLRLCRSTLTAFSEVVGHTRYLDGGLLDILLATNHLASRTKAVCLGWEGHMAKDRVHPLMEICAYGHKQSRRDLVF